MNNYCSTRPVPYIKIGRQFLLGGYCAHVSSAGTEDHLREGVARGTEERRDALIGTTCQEMPFPTAERLRRMLEARHGGAAVIRRNGRVGRGNACKIAVTFRFSPACLSLVLGGNRLVTLM